MDHGRIKAEQRALYESGEYGALSNTVRPVAQELALSAGVDRGQRVLDVGTGDGNLAIEVASRGALAVGCDLSMVQISRALQRDERIAWLSADAERLPFPDQTFDAVLSCFGAVFAPDPERATAELFRVVTPGGVVAVTSWADDGFMGEITAALRSAFPSPDSFPDQDLGWGSPLTARARFSAHTPSVEVRRRTLLIDPSVRGAAGNADFAARYLAQRIPSTDLGTVSAEISRRHLHANGFVRSDYLLILGRSAD